MKTINVLRKQSFACVGIHVTSKNCYLVCCKQVNTKFSVNKYGHYRIMNMNTFCTCILHVLHQDNQEKHIKLCPKMVTNWHYLVKHWGLTKFKPLHAMQ